MRRLLLTRCRQTDGFIDFSRTSGHPAKISNELTQMLAHKRRAEHTAILIGRKTALLDNPSLTTREWYGQNPTRLVIDKYLSLPSSLHLFDGKVPTIVLTQEKKVSDYPNTTFVTLDFERDILPQIMQVLYEQNLQSLLVEGGQTLLQSMIDAGLWDEAFVEKGTIMLGDGVKAPVINAPFEKYTCMGRTYLYYSNSAI